MFTLFPVAADSRTLRSKEEGTIHRPVHAGTAGWTDMQETQDLYQILEVNPTADRDAILAAYKILALTYHPDRNAAADACRLMTRLNQAFEILGAPASRAAYDQQRASRSGGWGPFGEADRLGRRRERFGRSGSVPWAGPSRFNSCSYSQKRGFWSRWMPDIHAGIF